MANPFSRSGSSDRTSQRSESRRDPLKRQAKAVCPRHSSSLRQMDGTESRRVRPGRRLQSQSRGATFSNSPPNTLMTLRADGLFLVPQRTPRRELKPNESCLFIVKLTHRLIATIMLIVFAAALAFSVFPRLATAEGTPRGKE